MFPIPPDMQRALSGQLVGIYAARLEASERRLDRLAAALEGCAPDADPTCAVLDAWRQEEQIWVDGWMAGWIACPTRKNSWMHFGMRGSTCIDPVHHAHAPHHRSATHSAYGVLYSR